MHTLHAPHIQAKDLKTSENHKEPGMKRNGTSKKKKKKTKQNKTPNKTKSSTAQQQQTTKNSHHRQLSYRLPYTKPLKNAWEALTDDS